MTVPRSSNSARARLPSSSCVELQRIERRPIGLVLVPQPRGRLGHDFALASASERSVVFENAGDDRVARIGFAILGGELVARIEYREAGRVERTHMRRASRCP